jgi:hypothetical protein
MTDKIPEHHLVAIAAAATAVVSMQAREDPPKWKRNTRIRIRMPIVIRPRKSAEPAPEQPEKKEA